MCDLWIQFILQTGQALPHTCKDLSFVGGLRPKALYAVRHSWLEPFLHLGPLRYASRARLGRSPVELCAWLCVILSHVFPVFWPSASLSGYRNRSLVPRAENLES